MDQVSELLGSFGDNELSPECLDGAQRFLKPDGISIPSSYWTFSYTYFSLIPDVQIYLISLIVCSLKKKMIVCLWFFADTLVLSNQ